MSIYLKSNAASLNISSHLNTVTANLSKSLEKLSSGYKINRASDGAAALLVSENLRSQIRGTDVATTNVQQGVSMLSTADSALQDIITHIQNIRDIALAASNSSTTADQFTEYTNQLVQEKAAITAITANTKYDTHVLLDGSISGGAAFNIQMGANSGDTLDIKSAFTDNTAATLGFATAAIATTANADTVLGEADAALTTALGNLALIGGYESRLDNQLNYLSIAKENYTSAEASIRNTDVAAETAKITQLQILQQAAAYALAQANSMPSLALQLLQ